MSEFPPEQPVVRTKRDSLRFSTRDMALRLFLTSWLVYVLHFATNTVREIYPALALGDDQSLDVSEYLGLHPDIFQVEGHGTFINNNPGASILGAIPYTLTRPIIDMIVARVQHARAESHQSPPEYKSIYRLAREFYQAAYARGYDVKFGLAAAVMQAFLMAPLSALGAVVMFFILQSLTKSLWTALFLSVLYAFATPVFYRTAQLSQNLLIADFALFAFALLWQPWKQSLGPGRRSYLLAGLLTGWTLVLDYSGLVVVSALTVYAYVRWRALTRQTKSRFHLVSFAVGAVVGIVFLLSYQWLAFGNPIFPAQHYMPPTQYSSYGFNGMGLPQLDLLWDTAFGIHFGLFAFAPLLLLALYVPAWFDPCMRLIGDRETWFILLFTLAMFLFASASEYGRLQFNSGVRYVVPVTPFLFLLVAGVLVRLPKPVAIVIGIVTTYWSWCLAMYRDVEQAGGVFDSIIQISTRGLRLPWLTTLQNLGFISGNLPTIVVLLGCAAIIWLLWNSNLPTLRLIPHFNLRGRLYL